MAIIKAVPPTSATALPPLRRQRIGRQLIQQAREGVLRHGEVLSSAWSAPPPGLAEPILVRRDVNCSRCLRAGLGENRHISRGHPISTDATTAVRMSGIARPRFAGRPPVAGRPPGCTFCATNREGAMSRQSGFAVLLLLPFAAVGVSACAGEDDASVDPADATAGAELADRGAHARPCGSVDEFPRPNIGAQDIVAGSDGNLWYATGDLFLGRVSTRDGSVT